MVVNILFFLFQIKAGYYIVLFLVWSRFISLIFFYIQKYLQCNIARFKNSAKLILKLLQLPNFCSQIVQLVSQNQNNMYIWLYQCIQLHYNSKSPMRNNNIVPPYKHEQFKIQVDNIRFFLIFTVLGTYTIRDFNFIKFCLIDQKPYTTARSTLIPQIPLLYNSNSN